MNYTTYDINDDILIIMLLHCEVVCKYDTTVAKCHRLHIVSVDQNRVQIFMLILSYSTFRFIDPHPVFSRLIQRFGLCYGLCVTCLCVCNVSVGLLWINA